MNERILQLVFVAIVGSAPNFALASPTWESTYNGNSYCIWSFTNTFQQIEIGQACTEEGEEVEIFAGGTLGYECDTYSTEYLVCCGDKIKCPKDPVQYED